MCAVFVALHLDFLVHALQDPPDARLAQVVLLAEPVHYPVPFVTFLSHALPVSVHLNVANVCGLDFVAVEGCYYALCQ